MNNSLHRKERATEYDECTVSRVSEAIATLCPLWVENATPIFEDNSRDDFLGAPFSVTEFKIALESGKSSSSPGPDGVDYEILKALPDDLKMALLLFINEIYEKGIFPHEWNTFGVFFIPKRIRISFAPYL